MAAINIFYDDIFATSIIDNTINLKKNGVIAKQYYIPKKYEIEYVGPAMMNFGNKHAHQIIITHKHKKPTFIPEGFENLQFYFTGVYQVTSPKSYFRQYWNEYGDRKLHYIDTSLIDLSSFKNLASKFNIEEVQIPDSFWYSSDYRDLRDGWENLEMAIEYAENFDKANGSRLITQMELLCIFYFQIFMTPEFIKDGFEFDKSLELENEIITTTIFPHLENWDFPVMSGINEYRRMSYFEIDYDMIKFHNEELDLYNCPEQAMLSIPVISQKVKK